MRVRVLSVRFSFLPSSFTRLCLPLASCPSVGYHGRRKNIPSADNSRQSSFFVWTLKYVRIYLYIISRNDRNSDFLTSAFQVHSTSFTPFSSSIDWLVMESVYQALIYYMMTCFSSSNWIKICGWVGVTDIKKNQVSVDWSLINQESIKSDS